MKKYKPGAAFWALGALVLSLWASTPFWVPPAAELVRAHASATQSERPQAPDPADGSSATTAAPRSEQTSASLTEASQFGDMFGSVSALLSGLAFLGMVYSIYLQVDSRRRDRQPEVFPRLLEDGSLSRDPPTISLIDDTTGGVKRFELKLVVSTMNAAEVVAYNVSLFFSVGQESSEAQIAEPLASSTNPVRTERRIQVKAEALAGVSAPWSRGDFSSLALCTATVRATFNNNQQASWSTSVEYELSARNDEDAAVISEWVNTTPSGEQAARSLVLESRCISWETHEV